MSKCWLLRGIQDKRDHPGSGDTHIRGDVCEQLNYGTRRDELGTLRDLSRVFRKSGGPGCRKVSLRSEPCTEAWRPLSSYRREREQCKQRFGGVKAPQSLKPRVCGGTWGGTQLEGQLWPHWDGFTCHIQELELPVETVGNHWGLWRRRVTWSDECYDDHLSGRAKGGLERQEAGDTENEAGDAW